RRATSSTSPTPRSSRSSSTSPTEASATTTSACATRTWTWVTALRTSRRQGIAPTTAFPARRTTACRRIRPTRIRSLRSSSRAARSPWIPSSLRTSATMTPSSTAGCSATARRPSIAPAGTVPATDPSQLSASTMRSHPARVGPHCRFQPLVSEGVDPFRGLVRVGPGRHLLQGSRPDMNHTLTVLGLVALLAVLAALVRMADTGDTPAPPPTGATTPPPAKAGSDIAQVSGIRLRTQLTHPYVTTGATEAFLVVSLEALGGLPKTRLPVDLALVLDRSASMAGPRLRHAREAARQLIHSLSEHDHLAIIHYGSEAVALPSLRADAGGRAQMLAFVDAIEAEGGTHLEEALQVAAEALGSHRPALTRVLLVSDGQPTVGEVEPDALISMVEAMRRRGLTLDALGVGEDFNEELLAALARAGDGTYAYLRNEAAL